MNHFFLQQQARAFLSRHFLPSLQSAGNRLTAQVPAGFPLGQGYKIKVIDYL
jgi:hypothetical protein